MFFCVKEGVEEFCFQLFFEYWDRVVERVCVITQLRSSVLVFDGWCSNHLMPFIIMANLTLAPAVHGLHTLIVSWFGQNHLLN